MSTYLVENDLWKEFLTGRSPEIREQLVIQSVPLVHYILGRLGVSPSIGTDYEDLAHQGLLGLIDAVDKYDPSYETKFATYASVRVRGKILDYLRSADWMPRSARKRVREIRQATSQLWSELYREPTDAEIANHLDINVEEVRQGMQDSSKVIISLDTYFDHPDQREDDGYKVIKDENQPDPSELFMETDLKEELIHAIKQLSEREQQVLSLYYYEELTFKEIGHVLQISESRVCQLHGRAVTNIKALLEHE